MIDFLPDSKGGFRVNYKKSPLRGEAKCLRKSLASGAPQHPPHAPATDHWVAVTCLRLGLLVTPAIGH